MKLLFIILLCGVFLPLVKSLEQTCTVNDIRVLVLQVKQISAEIQQFKEETAALMKELEDFELLESTTSLLLNKILTLDDIFRQAAAKRDETDKTIQSRVSELTTTIEELLDATKTQRNRLNETLLEQVVDIKKSIVDYAVDIEKLKTLANSTAKETNVLNSTLTSNNNKTVALINRVNATLKNHSDALETLQNNKVITKPAVGFRAKTLDNPRVTYCNGTLPFGTIEFETGGVFNNNTGFFTAPYSATYLFSAQVCVNSRAWSNFVYFSIVSPTKGVLSKSQGEVFCEAATTVAYLLKGEEVFVNCTKPNNATTDSYHFTMFSGALIQ